MLALLSREQQLINTTRPGGTSRYTVLHQAAYGGARRRGRKNLLGLGAWRTLRTAQGERALDITTRKGHGHLSGLLAPVLKHNVPLDALGQIQQHFHAVIRRRADELVREHALRLPELEPLLEMASKSSGLPCRACTAASTSGSIGWPAIPC